MAKKMVYKVVGIRENKLVSAWVGARYKTPFALEYAEGKITKAPKRTAIFTFESLEAAKDWAFDYFNESQVQIWECSGNLCLRQSNRVVSSSCITGGNYKTIAQLAKALRDFNQAPVRGTIFCSAITLLKRVI
ncbi:MAG: hypothetical protein UT69_C0037G0007 [Candidatus Yanofskybacteria bacterium GW2011_GWE1_40_10]|nr:MAG: hypothetical protein UT69_C0037G0007 [Candidatus Yanofskybacteria bacterium GW2011_GWE1_40_10]